MVVSTLLAPSIADVFSTIMRQIEQPSQILFPPLLPLAGRDSPWRSAGPLSDALLTLLEALSIAPVAGRLLTLRRPCLPRLILVSSIQAENAPPGHSRVVSLCQSDPFSDHGRRVVALLEGFEEERPSTVTPSPRISFLGRSSLLPGHSSLYQETGPAPHRSLDLHLLS